MATEDPNTPDQHEDPNWKQVRDKLDRLEAENQRLRAENLSTKVEALGLDPDKGVVKLALKEFVSDSEDQSASSLKSYLTDLGLMEDDGSGDDDPSTPPPPPSEADQTHQSQAAELGRRQQTLRNAGQAPSAEPTIDERIAEAEANGDWTTSIRLKLDQARDVLGMP